MHRVPFVQNVTNPWMWQLSFGIDWCFRFHSSGDVAPFCALKKICSKLFPTCLTFFVHKHLFKPMCPLDTICSLKHSCSTQFAPSKWSPLLHRNICPLHNICSEICVPSNIFVPSKKAQQHLFEYLDPPKKMCSLTKICSKSSTLKKIRANICDTGNTFVSSKQRGDSIPRAALVAWSRSRWITPLGRIFLDSRPHETRFSDSHVGTASAPLEYVYRLHLG